MRNIGMRMVAAVIFTCGVAIISGRAAASTATQRLAPATLLATPRGNGLIAYVSNLTGNNDIYSMFLDGSGRTDITNNAASDLQPAWSPDGTKIAFTSNRNGDNDVFVMNADGSNPVDVTNAKKADSQPSWSPDGTKIAFVSNRTGNNDIYVMNADGSNQVDITNNAASDIQPAWSPDGTKIAFVSNRTGNNDVYVMTPSGSNVVDLTNNAASDLQPAWSPDGTEIAFSTNRTGNNEIYLMNSADGTGLTDLTNSKASDTEPVFSPDSGLRIDYTSKHGGISDIYTTNLPGTVTLNLQSNLTQNTTASATSADWQPLPPLTPSGSPIQHVVVIYQENHSFDDVLGKFCWEATQGTIHRDPCDGAVTGQLHTGQVISLNPANDIPPSVPHSGPTAVTAMNGGAMNGFDIIGKCDATTSPPYQCYVNFDPTQIPSMATLATDFTVEDHTFEAAPYGSWGSHLDLAAAFMDGFYQATHHRQVSTGINGWGCDSGVVGQWQATPTSSQTSYPTCIPQQNGFGPFEASPVPWEPTIMDRLDQAGKTWRLYASFANDSDYGYSICPTFADCLYTTQTQNWFAQSQFFTDAANGLLPNLSFVMPEAGNSQHNGSSMLTGDNWISSLVSAVENGPNWNSTAIFIAYDDCGCFYDHVAPPAGSGLGIRSPFLIVSPYAKPGYTDSTIASFNGILAFTEHTFGLAPLSSWDASAYEFSNSFNFAQAPIAPVKLTQHPLPQWEARYLKAHPADPAEDPSGT